MFLFGSLVWITGIENFEKWKSYFFFDDKYVCMVFVIDQFFDIFINPRWIPFITNNCFMRKIIGNYVLNGFVK